MKNFLRVVLLCVCTALPTLAFGQSASVAQISRKDLGVSIDQFSTYVQDLNKMRHNVPDQETEIVDSLIEIARETYDHLIAIDIMISIFNDVESKPDRARVRPLLLGYIKINSQFAEKDVDHATARATLSKVPAVAQTGLKMRDDLRAAVRALEGLTILIKTDDN